MPVPKRKRSRARRDSRFANKGMEVKTLASCNNCQKAINSHTACFYCGFYKGRKIMATKSDHSERKDLARQVLKEREEKKAASGSSSSNQG